MSSETFRRLLLEANVLDDARLQKAEAAAQSRGTPLERTIVQLNLADETTVWRALAKAHGMKFVDPAKLQPQPQALAKVPTEQIEQNEALPVLLKDGELWVAIDDPFKTFVADNLLAKHDENYVPRQMGDMTEAQAKAVVAETR